MPTVPSDIDIAQAATLRPITEVAAEKKVREWVSKDAKLALGDREWNVKDLLARVERELQR